MSLQEILKEELGYNKNINVNNCKIFGDMNDDLDAINKKYFNDNLPIVSGNMSYIGDDVIIGQHYKTSSISGNLADKSALIEDNVSFNFSLKNVDGIDNITANSYKIPSGTNQFVLLADGTTAQYNAGGGQSNFYLYQNDTDITVPPSTNGHIQYNNVIQQNATIIWINHLTQDNIDIDYYLNQILINDIIYIQDKNNSLNWIKYLITGKNQIPNQYTSLNVSFDSGEGLGLSSFGNNHPIFFTIYINQNLINERLNELELRTRYQSSLTSNQTTFINTLNTDIINSNNIYKIGGGEYITDTQADNTYLKIIDEANPQPITLSNSGLYTSLLNSTTNPNFTTKSINVSSGLSITDSTDNITINLTGGTSMSSGYPFNPIQNATTTIGSGSKAYYYICLMSQATTISGIQLYLSSGGSDTFRCGIYRGYIRTAVSGFITLCGQTTSTTLTTGLPYNRKAIVAEPGQNLNFAVGEYMTIAVHSSGSTNVYMQNAPLSTGDTQIMFNSSSNYASAGFPANLTQSSILGTIVNKICFELY